MRRIHQISFFANANPTIISLGKAVILIALLSVVYWQLFIQNDIDQLSVEFLSALNRSNNLPYLIIALFLMPLNWVLESKKWQMLLQPFQILTAKEAMECVLSGVSLAIMTPARIGEYGGRLININKENRAYGLLANFVSSLSQNLVNITLGLVCTLVFVDVVFDLHYSILWSISGIGIIAILIVSITYFQIRFLKNVLDLLPSWKWIKYLNSKAEHLIQYDNSILNKVLLFSSVRYLVYTAQYVLLILFFGVTDDVLLSVLGVSTIFFLQSNIPLPPAMSVIARGEMAIFLWSAFTTNVLGILSATFLLWSINLLLPALVGMVFILKKK